MDSIYFLLIPLKSFCFDLLLRNTNRKKFCFVFLKIGFKSLQPIVLFFTNSNYKFHWTITSLQILSIEDKLAHYPTWPFVLILPKSISWTIEYWFLLSRIPSDIYIAPNKFIEQRACYQCIVGSAILIRPLWQILTHYFFLPGLFCPWQDIGICHYYLWWLFHLNSSFHTLCLHNDNNNQD